MGSWEVACGAQGRQGARGQACRPECRDTSKTWGAGLFQVRNSDPSLSITMVELRKGPSRDHIAQPSPFVQTGTRGPVRVGRGSPTSASSVPELGPPSTCLPSRRPSPSPPWQLPTLEMVNPGQKTVPIRPKAQRHHPKATDASQRPWKVQVAALKEACWAEGAARGRGRGGSLGLQLPAGLPSLQGAGAAGAGRRVSRSWPQPAHLQTAACFLPLRFLFGVSFRGQPSLIASRAGSPLPRAPPQGGRWVQEATANTALPLHRKQVGLVDPAPHRGSPHLEARFKLEKPPVQVPV